MSLGILPPLTSVQDSRFLGHKPDTFARLSQTRRRFEQGNADSSWSFRLQSYLLLSIERDGRHSSDYTAIPPALQYYPQSKPSMTLLQIRSSQPSLRKMTTAPNRKPRMNRVYRNSPQDMVFR